MAAHILPAGLPAGFVAEHSLPEFAATIGGAQHMKPPEVIEQLYHLFNAASAASLPCQPSLAHWQAVEDLMRSSYYVDPADGKTMPLNGHWPPANGGYQRQTAQLKEGDRYDRYQGSVFDKTENPITSEFDVDHVTGDVFDVTFGGNFVSPLGQTNVLGVPQSFESRALNMTEDKYPFKYTIDILQDVPTDAVYGEVANVIPWYGQPGGQPARGGLVSGSLGDTDGSILLPGGSPHLKYYRPLEAPQEQYLRLYTNHFAPGERPNEMPSYADLYALAQVELDGEHFLFLLRQAIDAAREARP